MKEGEHRPLSEGTREERNPTHAPPRRVFCKMGDNGGLDGIGGGVEGFEQNKVGRWLEVRHKM
jgi:hypothetical protein